MWPAVAAGCALAMFSGVQAGSSASRRQQSCVPYIVIDTRGSGEAQGTLSPPGQHFVTEWKKLHPGATVVVVKNPYPAVGAGRYGFTFFGAVLKAPAGYHHSVVAGKNWLESELEGFAHCGDSTSIVLTGYSQGAQVTADVVQAISPPLVVGVALFGDPYFNSADTVDDGGFQAGRNGFLGRRHRFSAYWRSRVVSYCHLHDPVCQGPLHNVGYLLSQHTTYDKWGEPEAAARYFFLTSIARGDFNTLSGNKWKETAYATNAEDGTGVQWHYGSLGKPTLTIERHKLLFGPGPYTTVVTHHGIAPDGGQVLPLRWTIGTDVLTASIPDNVVPAINWAVLFFPNGRGGSVRKALGPNNGVRFDRGPAIVLWNSPGEANVFQP